MNDKVQNFALQVFIFLLMFSLTFSKFGFLSKLSPKMLLLKETEQKACWLTKVLCLGSSSPYGRRGLEHSPARRG